MNLTMSATEKNGDSKMISAAYGPMDFAHGVTSADVIEFIHSTWVNA